MGQTLYSCMPLVANVPEGRDGWQRATCPECGAACWRLPQIDQLPRVFAGAPIRPLCTPCALRREGR